MKAVGSVSSIIAALVSVLLQTVMPIGAALASEVSHIEMPVGTPLILTFEESVNPITAHIGQRVFLRVEDPVTVEGKILIEAGARAIGEITQSAKAGSIGKPGAIGVTLRSVEAIDGTSVPISGNKVIIGEDKQTASLIVTILCCVLGLIMKGGPAEIAQGSTVEANIAMAAKIQTTEDSVETEID